MTKITQADLNATLRTAHSGHRLARPARAAASPGNRLAALVFSLLAGCALAFASIAPAHAQRHDPQVAMERDDGRVGRMQNKNERDMMRAELMMQREDDARRRAEMMQERADPVRRNSRLTPEERRDLRRQIDRVGQDIYKR